MTYYYSKVLDMPLPQAVERTKVVLSEHGFGVVTEIDMMTTLKNKIGAEIEPYQILGACSPKHAYAALQSEPHIGLMLPCNVIVREIEPGKSEVSAVDPVASMQAIENTDLIGVASEVQRLLHETIDDL